MERNKSHTLLFFSDCLSSKTTDDYDTLTNWPLQGPGANAVWEDRRDIRLLETHAGNLTFSTRSPHLQQAHTNMSILYFQIEICSSIQKSTKITVNNSIFQPSITFCIELRQGPPHEVLLLVVCSRSFPLLLQKILLSPPLRVVFPQCWDLWSAQLWACFHTTDNTFFQWRIGGFEMCGQICLHTLKYSASSSGGFRSSSSNRISSFVMSAQYGSTDAQNLKWLVRY